MKNTNLTNGNSTDNRINNDEQNQEDEDGMNCPICLELWTNAGDHRLCALKCGHLFGQSCIVRWLKESCNSTNRRCPHCNKKAAVKDILIIYAKKLQQLDTAELENIRKELANATEAKNQLEAQLAKVQFYY